MTIASSTRQSLHPGDGNTVSFGLNARVDNKSHLKVTRIAEDGTRTVLSVGTQFGVSGLGDDDGVTVTCPLSGSPLSEDEQLLIEILVPLTQETSLRNQSAFFPHIHERALDHLTRGVQQVSDTASRSLRTKAGETAAMELPDKQDRAAKVLGFDSNGEPAVSDKTLTQLESEADAAAVSAAAASVSASGAETARTAAQTARDEAVAARDLSEAARDTALGAQTDAETARDAAITAQGDAEDARDLALGHKTDAANSASAAASSAATAATYALELSSPGLLGHESGGGAQAHEIGLGGGLSFSGSSLRVSVDTAQIENDAVSNAKIAPGAVDTTELAADAVTSAKIANGAVDTEHLASGAVTSPKIGTSAVGTTALASQSVTEAKLATGAVTGNKIGAGAVDTAELASGAVTSAKIDNSAVSETKIASGAVTNAKLATNAVTHAKIQDGSVINAKLGASAVTSDKIAPNTIQPNRLVAATEASLIASAGAGSFTVLPIDTDDFSFAGGKLGLAGGGGTYVPTSREIIAGVGLNGGGTLDGDVTLSVSPHDVSVVHDGAPASNDVLTVSDTSDDHTPKRLYISDLAEGVLNIPNTYVDTLANNDVFIVWDVSDSGTKWKLASVDDVADYIGAAASGGFSGEEAFANDLSPWAAGNPVTIAHNGVEPLFLKLHLWCWNPGGDGAFSFFDKIEVDGCFAIDGGSNRVPLGVKITNTDIVVASVGVPHVVNFQSPSASQALDPTKWWLVASWLENLA